MTPLWIAPTRLVLLIGIHTCLSKLTVRLLKAIKVGADPLEMPITTEISASPRLSSWCKLVFSMEGLLLLPILVLVLFLQVLLYRLFFLRLLPFQLVTANCTSTGTSTSCNCGSTTSITRTCTFSKVKRLDVRNHIYKKCESCGALLTQISYYYSSSASELIKLITNL